jgi:hypothetical protein
MSSMMPPDFAAAMGGGAPAPGPEAGGLPPDLAAMLGGGAPEEEAAAPPSITDGAPGAGEESLVMALDALQDAIDAEADQEDIQVMLQCQAKLQGILAKNQKDADASMGGNLAPAAARKMAGSLGA